MLSLLQLANAFMVLGPLASAALLPRQQRDFCSTQADADILALHEKLAKDKPDFTRRDTGELISLDAWVHVVAVNETKQGGWLTDEEISGQMKILNDAYAPSNLTFNLAGTTRTKNASWADKPEIFEKDLKTKLHRGTSRTLNLYYAPGLGAGGVCVFPNMNAYEGEALAKNGCMVGSFSLPGNKPPFNQGLTTVHEVGHWFGLLHTFEGGCNEKGGDFIADTPAEASPNWGECPVGRDTCPDMPGLDPVENYMDYSADSCYSRFTPGQIVRMRSILSLIRLGI